ALDGRPAHIRAFEQRHDRDVQGFGHVNERFRIFLMALVAFFYGPYFLLHIEFMKNELTKCARYAHALEVMGKNCE
ncbi:MAG: hypothetical protein WA196_09030, partial [Pseudolabrys sp.]